MSENTNPGQNDKKQSFFQWLDSKFGLASPKFPDDETYEKITEYLIKELKSSIRYYAVVTIIGLAGIVIALSYMNFNLAQLSSIADPKQAPAIIWSITTVAFGYLEHERKKKELYARLKEIAQSQGLHTDREMITSDYKKWAWTEFQDKFKPEK